MTTSGLLVLHAVGVLLVLWILNQVRVGRLYVGYGVAFLLSVAGLLTALSVPVLRGSIGVALQKLFPSDGDLVVAVCIVLFGFVYVLTQLTILSNRLFHSRPRARDPWHHGPGSVSYRGLMGLTDSGDAASSDLGDRSRRSGTDCTICRGTAPRFLFELHQPLFQCTECGLVFAGQEASYEPGSVYSETYYRGSVYADYVADRGSIIKNANRALAKLELLTPGRRLLDIGCATGHFLEAARARGWEGMGLEVSEYASEYARTKLGLVVRTGSIVQPPQDLPEFDVVTMWDIIEHLTHPDVALHRIRERLRPDGVLAISTGDYGSLLRRITGRRWRLFKDPTHLFFFDERTLRRLLTESGYHVLSLRRVGKWVSLSMILHQAPLPLAKRISVWLERHAFRPSVYVNPRDVMTVLVKRAR